jgi:hypothetical protein
VVSNRLQREFLKLPLAMHIEGEDRRRVKIPRLSRPGKDVSQPLSRSALWRILDGSVNPVRVVVANVASEKAT